MSPGRSKIQALSWLTRLVQFLVILTVAHVAVLYINYVHYTYCRRTLFHVLFVSDSTMCRALNQLSGLATAVPLQSARALQLFG